MAVSNAAPSSPRTGPAAGIILCFGLLYLGAALLGHALTLPLSHVASFWPAAGLYLAALLLAPPSRWPAIIAAGTAANLVSDTLVLGRPVGLVLGFALANGLEALFGAWLVRRVLRHGEASEGTGNITAISPGSLRTVAIIGGAALTAPILGATIGATDMTLMEGPAAFARVWKVWWAADVVGVAVAAPLALASVAILRDIRADPRRAAARAVSARGREGAAALLLVTAAAAGVFWTSVSPGQPIAFLALPPLLWPALRLGAGATALACALLALIAASGSAAGHGPFAVPTLAPMLQPVLLQLFLYVATVTAQALAVAEAERRRATAALGALNLGLTAQVTERGTALAMREAELSGLFAASPVGITRADLDGRIHEANDAFLRIVGLSHATLSAEPLRWDALTAPEYRAADRAAIAEAMASPDGRCRPFEKEYIRPDGSRVPVLVSFALIDRGSGLCAAFIVDLSEQRRAEATARRALDELQMVYATAPVGLCVLDRDLRWVRINAHLAEINGAPAEAHIGRRIGEILPDLAEAGEALGRRVLDSGEPVLNVEITGETPARPGVRRIWMEDWLPLRDAAGQVTGINVVAREVTEQRAAEAALAELNRHLEERVRTEVAAREEAQARAAHAERMQALGQLAGGIAHDFNNVLQAVQAGAGLIEHRVADPASVRRFARTVLNAAERGAAITRRLLAFARRGELRAEPIEPATLLDGMRDVLSHTLGSPVSVRVDIGPDLPALLADRGQLETVLVNFATNARDAMPEGGTLTLAAAVEQIPPRPLHPMGLKPGRYVRLSATDTGTGMDRATLARACEPFFTTKAQEHGTGLGLSMARGFAEQSGGALAVDSAPGRGTTVTLWLPAPERLHEATTPRSARPPPGAVRRVLIVDDEDTVRETLAAGLEDAGFDVLTAESGAEALALLEAEETVEVLVCDLAMPGMGGIALIRAAEACRPGLQAILLTGYMGEEAQMAVGGALSGTFSLLRKPVTIAQLADRIEMLFARAESRGR